MSNRETRSAATDRERTRAEYFEAQAIKEIVLSRNGRSEVTTAKAQVHATTAVAYALLALLYGDKP